MNECHFCHFLAYQVYLMGTLSSLLGSVSTGMAKLVNAVDLESADH